MFKPGINQSLLSAISGCTSWNDLHSKWGSFTDKEKGQRFEYLTQAFLQISPIYRSQLKSVWRLEDVPSDIRNKLKLPSSDKGIDLIAETRKGEFWAIQCKYRQNTDQQLTHTDISTFTSLTFQACKGFSFALVCTTTERVTSLYRGEERIGFCALDTWQDLGPEFFDDLRAELTNKPTIPNPCSPRPHQENAVQDGLEHFAKGKASRGKLIMPCGTGKSLTAWFLAHALGSKRIVIAVPSLSLVKQTLKVWSRESVANNIDVEWICVCSDETAGKADQDDVVLQRQDIAVPCYTSTDKIADWLRAEHRGLTVVFTTYQSGQVLATAARKAKFGFDLGIMDEAHKTVGDGDKLFSHLIHDHNIEIRHRVFMTATERRFSGSSDKILSMDDPEVYGETFHLLTFKKAMEVVEGERQILCDYNVITIGVSRQEVKELIKKNLFIRPDSGKWDEDMEADMLAAMVALRKAMKEYPIKHAVSFHGSIRRAEQFRDYNDSFTAEFPAFGELSTFHVSGQTPTGTRSNIIKQFAQADRALVTNARCLTEGVDVPSIDCVLFADPKKSKVDIVQAVGRALRPAQGKKLGYVILPVLHDEDSGDLKDSGAFKEVIDMLANLASQDERIIEEFRAISQGRLPATSGHVRFDFNEKVSTRVDIADFTEGLKLKCWERLAKLSWRPFEQARSYVHSLKLKSQSEWDKYADGMLKEKGILPPDIPKAPRYTYRNKGWISMGDWIGTGRVADQLKRFLDYSDAQKFSASLGLNSKDAWFAYCKGEYLDLPPLPNDIPANPPGTYKANGWIGWGQWLGTGTINTKNKAYCAYSDAIVFVHALKLKTKDEWAAYCKGDIHGKPLKPDNIPSTPNRTYNRAGWNSWGQWLGTGYIHPSKRDYLPFEIAKKYVRKLRLKSADEWAAYCKGEMPSLNPKPESIPADPRRVYRKSGWIDLADWIGTDFVHHSKREYLPFEEARKFVRSLKLKTNNDWLAYCKGKLRGRKHRQSNIPTRPERTYADSGWISLGDWIGTNYVHPSQRTHLSFTEARRFVHSLGLTSRNEWNAYCKGKIPGHPPKPNNIPAYPEQTYKDKGWAGVGDWLGTGFVHPKERTYLEFQEARRFVHGLKLKSRDEWRAYCKGLLPGKDPKPNNIPSGARNVYRNKGWISENDWLGI